MAEDFATRFGASGLKFLKFPLLRHQLSVSGASPSRKSRQRKPRDRVLESILEYHVDHSLMALA